jgi:hypothetical protein
LTELGDGGPDPWERAATALLLAYLLDETDVRSRGRAAAKLVRERLIGGISASAESAGGVSNAGDAAELAGYLADAEVAGMQRPTVPADEEIRALLATAGVADEDSAQALHADSAVRRMRGLVAVLDGPERGAALRRRLRPGVEWRAQWESAGEDLVRAAASAALARAASAALERRLAEHAAVVSSLAAELRAGVAGHCDASAVREVVEALAAASAARRDRARRLVEELVARLKPETAPILPSAAPDAEQLAWLRGIMGESLYTAQDARDGANWLGSDPFRLRELPSPPPDLAGIDMCAVAATDVVPLLRSLDLTRPNHARKAGAVSRCARTGNAIPRVLHAVWLGAPPAAGSAFLRNLGYAARRYAGQVDVVLWTDLTRDQAREPRDDATRHLIAWAAEHDVALIDSFEVFHADAPMITHPQYVLEMAKQLPRGYAAASDLLRLEIVLRFGGVYADGDVEYADQDRDPEMSGPAPENLVEFLDRLAGSDPGFAMDPLPRGGIGNDVVAGPASHRAIRLWLEESRVNYFRSHAQIFGGLTVLALPYVGEDRCALRYLAPNRTGRIHHRVAALIGLGREDLTATQPPFRFGSAGSWIPSSGQAQPPAPAAFPDDDEALIGALARCLTVLEWQSLAREGDLYLVGVDPVVRALPDPDAAWIALLTVFGSLPGAAEITSVTDVRRADDGSIERVALPPEAQILIDRITPRRSAQTTADWLGAGLSSDGSAVWLMDERVEAARVRDRDEPAAPLLDYLAPLIEVARTLTGRLVGLWIRPDDGSAEKWRYADRFSRLPDGWIGVSVGGRPGWDWFERWPLDAETLAELLLGAGAHGRPVLLSAPWGTTKSLGHVAARLAGILKQDVEIVEGPLRGPGPLTPPPLVPLRYSPWGRQGTSTPPHKTIYPEYCG